MGQGRKIVNKCHQASGQRGLNPAWELGDPTQNMHTEMSLWGMRKLGRGCLYQLAPNFLAPEIGFIEDNFSMDPRGWEWVKQRVGFRMIFIKECNIDPLHVQFTVGLVLLWDSNADLTGGWAQAVMQAMGSDWKYRWSFARTPIAHLLQCGLVPNRPWPGTSLWPGDWGLLIDTAVPINHFLRMAPCSAGWIGQH